MTDKKFRVERWTKSLDPNMFSWKYKEHYFSTSEEVEEYIAIHKKNYKLRVYEYTEKLIEEIDEDVEEEDITNEEIFAEEIFSKLK